MRTKFIFIVIFISLSIEFVNAQICVYDELVKEDSTNAYYLKRYPSQKNSANFISIIKIPVLFHIVYKDLPSRVSLAQIYAQLEFINKMFGECNSVPRDEFISIVGCPKIEFYLCQATIDGTSYSGIKYTETKSDYFSWSNRTLKFDSVKFTDPPFEPYKVLNIWVCNLRNQSDPSIRILGYTSPPKLQVWSNLDRNDSQIGIVLDYRNLTKQEDNYGLGTLSHEIGHFFGLRHIWGSSTNSCQEDDGIEDTPPCTGPTHTCDFDKNSCYEPNDRYDMVENVMDYAFNQCHTFFSIGQIELMRYNVVNYFNYYDYSFNSTSTISIYPNPATNFIEIATLNSTETISIELIDHTGKSLFIDAQPGALVIIDLTNIRPGVYYVLIRNRFSYEAHKVTIIN